MDKDATMRTVIQHFTDKFANTVADFADTANVSREGLQAYMDGDTQAISSLEGNRLSNFAAELIEAEKQEIADARFFARPEPPNVWKTIRDLEGA